MSMMRTTSVVVAALVVLAVLAGIGYYALRQGAGQGGLFAPATTTPLNTSAVSPQQAPTSAGSATTPNTSTHVTSAIIHTNLGDITIQFLADQAPNTVANFIKLASSGFYDGTKFHRVIKGFMDQGGDPLTKDDTQEARWGTGGPGYQFADENQQAHNGIGVVSMANAGPNTNGSQFFINAADNGFLDGKYNVFATVTAGLDVVMAINQVPTDSSDRPLSPVVVTGITLQ